MGGLWQQWGATAGGGCVGQQWEGDNGGGRFSAARGPNGLNYVQGWGLGGSQVTGG